MNPVSKGLLRIHVLQVTSQHYDQKDFNIRLSINTATYKIPARESKKQLPRFMPAGQALQIELFCNQQTDTRFGYFKLPLAKLYQQPKKNHIVKIQCIWKQKQDNSITQGPSGFTTLSIIYYQNPAIRLQIDVKQASLSRQTQQFGKMDPFTQIKVGEYLLKTQIKDQAGKNPIWNQNLTFNLDNVQSQFNITVKDKDMVYDDIVGSININPYQQQIYVVGKDKIKEKRQFVLSYEGKYAGRIIIQFLFSVIQT